MDPNMSSSSECLYEDAFFGKNGLLVWIFQPGVFFLTYQIYSSIESMLVHGPSITTLIFLVIMIVLLGAIIIFSYQSLITAQRIVVCGDTIKAYTFYGKKIKFRKLDVTSIEKVTLSIFFKHLTSPMGRGGENYKITLSSGVSFFINGTMSNVKRFIQSIGSFNLAPF